MRSSVIRATRPRLPTNEPRLTCQKKKDVHIERKAAVGITEVQDQLD
ncbi:MAG: hypothetical protein ACI9R3_004673 [Verrucomicrobiales bacterium]|jgi:hypothetical protein